MPVRIVPGAVAITIQPRRQEAIMRRSLVHRAPLVTVAAALLCAAPPLRAVTFSRQGGELAVNVHTSGTQDLPSVGIAADGRFVVVWHGGDNQDGDQLGAFGRRFAATGSAIGGEFVVNSYTPGSQTYAVIAVESDGDFVIAWRSYLQDGSGAGVFARRFDSAGTPLATEMQVNSFTTASQLQPAIAGNGAGAFVVVWASYTQDGDSGGIFARRFDASGTPQAVELQVNTYTVSFQLNPAVAMDGAGDFVVAWRSHYQDGAGDGVFARRFDAAGSALAVEFQVNTQTSGTELLPAIGMATGGDFMVVWRSDNQDGSGHGLFAQRFDSAGTRQAAEFQVNLFTPDSQQDAALAVDDDGEFIVAWMSAAEDGSSYGIFERRFDSAGAALGGEERINTYTQGAQVFPAVSARGGSFVVTWSSEEQDGEAYGIFAQRYVKLAVLDVDGNGSVTALTDGLLILRFLFGFTGTTLTSGAIGAGCTRCDGATIAPYLATLL
jgi:hypothetical protein